MTARDLPANKLGFGLLEGLPGLHSHDGADIVLCRNHQIIPPALQVSPLILNPSYNLLQLHTGHRKHIAMHFSEWFTHRTLCTGDRLGLSRPLAAPQQTWHTVYERWPSLLTHSLQP